MIKIAPSIMCGDSLNLAKELIELEQCDVHMLHCDVMDGRYVDNFAMGFYTIKAIKRATIIPLDVHLAVMEPERYISTLASIGVDMVSIHVERVKCLHRTIKQIKDMGMKVAIALNPATPESMIENVIRYVDMVLVMTVDPGFEGQSFIPETLEKIKKIRSLALDYNPNLMIQVDGNINLSNISQVVSAGADVLVLGTSALFNSKGNYKEKIEEINSLIRNIK